MADDAEPGRWWAWLWALALLAHVVGNPTPSDAGPGRAVANLVVGVLALAVLSGRGSLALLAAAGVVSFVAEAPLVGNHWLIAALVNLVVLGSRPWRSGWFARARSGLQLTLLLSYSFAAVAKLNTGFFDRDSSCARFFANQMLGFWQLPEVPPGSATTTVLAAGTAAVELLVPVLLVLRPTRRLGVVLAIGFHLVLTLDLAQHFFDFTLVLIPLFLLFWPSELAAAFVGRFQSLMGASERVWVWLLASMVLGATIASLPIVWRGLAVVVGWLLWLWAFVTIARVLVELVRGRATPVERPTPSLRAVGPVSLGVIGLVVLNGLSPYLEIKSATGYNMYSNLVTAGGDSNHHLVRATSELREGGGDLVLVTATNDEDLEAYVNSGFALPFTNFADFLADRPDTSVTYQRFRVGEDRGEPIVVDRAGDHAELMQRMPWWEEKFGLFRAVPLDSDAPACQNTWLPAR